MMDRSSCLPNEINDLSNNGDVLCACNDINHCANVVYYGIHIPLDMQIEESYNNVYVFTSKTEALKVVKKYKKARFKAFNTLKGAEGFALHGSECPNNNDSLNNDCSAKNQESPASVEKPSQFRGPKSQDLVKLRKEIEHGDVDAVRRIVWDNPRYLISIGDTPSILHEGSRYNALHVATRVKKHEMCELILNTIANVAFVQLLYVDDKNPEDRAKILLDLYLNTPDKGLHETPLHFAAKLGADKCVETLVSYPQCDKTSRNKFNKLPSEIICSRCEENDSSQIFLRISNLLQDNFYVPVLRSEDNCEPPVIGDPFSPKSPPAFNYDVRNARVEISAYAGPMNKTMADNFRKVWKTPPRSIRNIQSQSQPRNHNNHYQTNDKQYIVETLKLRDPERGLERVGQNLATKMGCGWKEYWPFLDSFIDLASKEGLEQFEQYLSTKINNNQAPENPAILTSNNNNNSGDFVVTSPKSSPRKSKFISFNNKPAINEVLSPMSELCNALQSCNLNETKQSYNNEEEESDDYYIKDSRKFHIEKALQVFAKLISDDILFEDKGQLLEIQCRQLQSLMVSYMSDKRFSDIDFQLVHSRLSSLISNKLLNVDLANVITLLDSWLDYCTKNCDSFSTDDESGNNTTSNAIPTKHQHTICIVKQLQDLLVVKSERTDEASAELTAITSEEECEVVWRNAQPCLCVWRAKTKTKKLLKWSSFQKSNVQENKVREDCKSVVISRRLCFNESLGEENCENGDRKDGRSDEAKNNEKNDVNWGKIDGNLKQLELNNLEVDSSDNSSDDEFFTPPSSPRLLEVEDNEVFDESCMPETEVFIEGDFPTKIDCAVYNALKYSECNLTPQEFPNIYRWQHAVSLYNDSERQSWLAPSVVRLALGGVGGATSTPYKGGATAAITTTSPVSVSSQQQQTPAPLSWLRVTGVNSPRASLSCHRGNISLNL